MIDHIKDSPLFPIANPESIVFFGASNNISSMGTNQFLSLKSLGFKGILYPIHPTEQQVQGIPAYRSVEDLPDSPDLAVLVVPTDAVPDLLEACGRKGVRSAIVVSAGFKEMGRDGLQREERLIRVVRKYGIRLLGPNCIGVANPHHQLNTTFMPYLAEPGFIGMASQSGSFVTQMFDYLAQYRLGFSTAFSVGNEADLDLVDCMEYLDACPHTRVIALYVEGISRGRKFLQTARRIVPRKPVVALYAGGSETGSRAGLSHTGAMAGPDPLYDGILRQSGVLRAHSISEMFDCCWVLGSLPRPAGARVAVQTHSGGPGTAAADVCGREGLEMPPMSPATRERLAPLVPKTASMENPVDLTYAKNPLDYFSKIPEILLREDSVDMLLIYFLFPFPNVKQALKLKGRTEDQAAREIHSVTEAQCEAIEHLVSTYGKPLLGYTFRGFQEPFIQGLLNRKIPVFPGPGRAARAMAAMVRYSRYRERLLEIKTHGRQRDTLP